VDIAAVIDISSAGLTRVLSNWLEPDEAARTLPVETAAALLSKGPEAASWPPEDAPTVLRQRPPTGSRITFTESRNGATYLLPMGARAGGRRMGSFGMIWLVFVGFWTYSALRMRAPAGFLLFAIPFLAVGVGVLRRALTSIFGHLELRIDGGGVSYSNRFLFASRRRSVPLDEVGDCRLDGGLFLDVGARTLRLGDGLSNREREWLRDSVNGLLWKLRGRQQF
jgi:hypothetical protein